MGEYVLGSDAPIATALGRSPAVMQLFTMHFGDPSILEAFRTGPGRWVSIIDIGPALSRLIGRGPRSAGDSLLGLDQVPDRVRVGTVDRFQGQQAPVVFYAMTCSTGEDVPRGIDFLFDGHRLNVAISRAHASPCSSTAPASWDADCTSLEAMTLVDGGPAVTWSSLGAQELEPGQLGG